MSKLPPAMKEAIVAFARDEDGAQIVEYALIVAVISIAFTVALQSLGGARMADFIARVTTCLTSATCT